MEVLLRRRTITTHAVTSLCRRLSGCRLFSVTVSAACATDASLEKKTKLRHSNGVCDDESGSRILFLSESDVQQCLPASVAIKASRVALGALRRPVEATGRSIFGDGDGDGDGDDGAGGGRGSKVWDWGEAIVPTRIGMPYAGRRGTWKDPEAEAKAKAKAEAEAADWTLFKPAAYCPAPSRTERNADDDTDDGMLMGLKVVSVRSSNRPPKSKVPATIMLLNAATGQVKCVLGGTYLTAMRTAAGCALATDLASCCSVGFADRHDMAATHDDETGQTTGQERERKHRRRREHLVVFGAGMQAKAHIEALRIVLKHDGLSKITVVNRSLDRARRLVEDMSSSPPSSSDVRDGIEWSVIPLKSDDDPNHSALRRALSTADVVCATTNSSSPLFDGAWVKPGCHVNGIGSYTPLMEEIDPAFIKSRCRVVIDTMEALDVGDLRLIRPDDDDDDDDDGKKDNFYDGAPNYKDIPTTTGNFMGLLGEMLRGEISYDECTLTSKTKERVGKDAEKEHALDCTMFKSVGTAIQDVVTAQAAYEVAVKKGIGTWVDM